MRPKIILARLICKVAEGGYSVGDNVDWNPSYDTYAKSRLVAVADATNIVTRLATRKLRPPQNNWRRLFHHPRQLALSRGGLRMTKYYVDATGSYLGGFDGVEPPKGAIDVSTAPAFDVRHRGAKTAL